MFETARVDSEAKIQSMFIIVSRHVKETVCKAEYKYLSWVYGVDRKICHEGH